MLLLYSTHSFESPWAAPLCIAATIPEICPLSYKHHCGSLLHETETVVSTVDLVCTYNQVLFVPEDFLKTAIMKPFYFISVKRHLTEHQ